MMVPQKVAFWKGNGTLNFKKNLGGRNRIIWPDNVKFPGCPKTIIFNQMDFLELLNPWY